MRIAYLILCHKNPEQVFALIRQLNEGNVYFYVHIDNKSANFELPKQHNIFVLPVEKRIDVRWATNSMVYAMLNLSRAALNANNQYDYICLLSGQDFPIKSNGEIQDYLQINNGANFIEILDPSHKLYCRYHKRSDVYYPSWMFGRSDFCKVIKRLYIYLTGGFNYTFPVFRRNAPNNISFAFGSQWWCLTQECLSWIVAYIDNNPDLLAFYDHSLTPDECVFQTIFMMSPFSTTAKDKLTFLEWDINGNNPRLLTKADYKMLVESEKLFARKFDIEKDHEIIDLLMQTNITKEPEIKLPDCS